MYNIINNYEKNIEKDKIEKYVHYLVNKLKIEDAIFNIIIIDNEEIRSLNREYRNIDSPTDVISFALEDSLDIKYDSFRLLGDIYISYDKVISQSEEYNHSVERELFFLITHGILHLLGYDHMSEEEEKEMFTLQKGLLDSYGTKR